MFIRPQLLHLRDAFDGSRHLDDIITTVELITGQTSNPETDLFILDKIGECEDAAT